MSVHAKEWQLCAVSVPAGIVCHAVCPNSRLNARFEGVGCLHTPSRVNGGKSLDFCELVGSCRRACDIGWPTSKQGVAGSSPAGPTINPFAVNEWLGPPSLQYPLEILLSAQQVVSKCATNVQREAAEEGTS
jgi:hypothetical protein